jgi:nucleotide-binding universal stress UspA family protein
MLGHQLSGATKVLIGSDGHERASQDVLRPDLGEILVGGCYEVQVGNDAPGTVALDFGDHNRMDAVGRHHARDLAKRRLRRDGNHAEAHGLQNRGAIELRRVKRVLERASAAPFDPFLEEIEPRHWERVLGVVRDEAESAVRGAAGEITEVPAQGRAIYGRSTQALTDLAGVEDARLIVVGSTHRGALGRVLVGSVGLPAPRRRSRRATGAGSRWPGPSGESGICVEHPPGPRGDVRSRCAAGRRRVVPKVVTFLERSRR